MYHCKNLCIIQYLEVKRNLKGSLSALTKPQRVLFSLKAVAWVLKVNRFYFKTTGRCKPPEQWKCNNREVVTITVGEPKAIAKLK